MISPQTNLGAPWLGKCIVTALLIIVYPPASGNTSVKNNFSGLLLVLARLMVVLYLALKSPTSQPCLCALQVGLYTLLLSAKMQELTKVMVRNI